jgi:hypothetical protein
MLAHELAVKIDEMASASDSSMFGGVVIGPNASDVTVYLTELSQNVEDGVDEQQTSVTSVIPIVFALTPTTESQQAELNAQVTQDVIGGYWGSQGVTVRSWYPDAPSGTEIVEALKPTAAQTSAIKARYGSNVQVKSVTGDTGIVRTYASRRSDSAPWNGGDFISNDNGKFCSSGIPVHNGANTYIMTAAHCFTNGTNIHNQGEGPNGTFGTNNPMGSISNRDITDGGTDVELQKVSSSDLLWTGGEGVDDRAIISGKTANVDGDQVCVDGAYEFEVCGAVIQHLGVCATEDNGRVACHLAEAKRSDSTVVAGPGDSGGPLFEFSGSNLQVVGTVVGAYGDSHPCTTVESGGQTCTNGVAYSEINYELDDFSVSVNTG